MNPFLHPDQMTPAFWKDKLRSSTGSHLSPVVINWGQAQVLSLLAFSSAPKWGSTSVPQGSCPLCRGIVKTPGCSWPMSHPPHALKTRTWHRSHDCLYLNPFLEGPSFFTSDFPPRKKHLFRGSLLRVPISWLKEALTLLCFCFS